jgi:cellulose biosynthesis protein BcsQ
MTNGRRSRDAARHAGSLTGPEGEGGIRAEKGFAFQARYAACKIPVWLLETGFDGLLYEGTGDIDLRYQQDRSSFRVHIQTKNHEIAPAEFKEIVERFRSWDRGMPEVYRYFTLVCPSLSAKMEAIEAGLGRLRNVEGFYEDRPDALTPTKNEVDERLRGIGLTHDEVDFVHSKVYFEIGYADLHDDEVAQDMFVVRLIKHPEYVGMTQESAKAAYAEILRVINGNLGCELKGAKLEQILRASLVWRTSVFGRIVEKVAVHLPLYLGSCILVWILASALSPQLYRDVTFWVCFPPVFAITLFWAWRGIVSGEPINPAQKTHSVKAEQVVRRAARVQQRKQTVRNTLSIQPSSGVPVIAVASGKGGVGKTLIATSLAHAAVSGGRRVLILDLDFFNRGLTGLFAQIQLQGNVIDPPAFLSGFADSGQWLLANPEPKLGDKLWTVVFPALPIEAIEGVGIVRLQKLCEELQEFMTTAAGLCRADLVILDCHGGPDPLSFAACAIAEHAIMVSEPDEVALYGLLNFIRLYESQTTAIADRFRLIYNKVPRGLTVASLRAAYSGSTKDAQPDVRRPSRSTLSAWFLGSELLMAIPYDETLIIPREGAFLPTLLYPWSPLAQKARTVLASFVAIQPNVVARVAGRRGLWPSLINSVWNTVQLSRRSFLGLNPLILDIAWWMRVAIALLMSYAVAGGVQKALTPERYKMGLESHRLIAIHLCDHHHWDQRPWFASDNWKATWSEMQAFATGRHTEPVDSRISQRVKDKVTLDGISERRARLEVEYDESNGFLDLLAQERSNGAVNDPQAIDDLKETLDVPNPLEILGRPSELHNDNSGPSYGYEQDKDKELLIFLQALRNAQNWEPNDPKYFQSWQDAVKVLRLVSIRRLKLLDALDYICLLHNALIGVFATCILCLGVWNVHRVTQRKAATALVRERYFGAVTWLAIAPVACVALLGLLRSLWEEMVLQKANDMVGYRLPSGDAIKLWLLLGTIVLVFVHTVYRMVAAAIEGHARREIFMRVALGFGAVGLLWATWRFDLRIIPQLIGSPP